MRAWHRRSLAAFGISLIASCGSSPPRATAGSPTPTQAQEAAEAPDTEIAPRPFTPEQIAAAMPLGTRVTYRFEPADKPAYLETWSVTAADAETVTMETRREHAHGTVETLPAATSKWSDLAAHATFPASATTITDDKLVTPAGTFATRLYVVQKDGGAVHRFHFAPALPGPPIRIEIEKNGAPQMIVTLVQREPSAPASDD